MTWLYVPSACAPESVDLISDSTKEPDARAWEELAQSVWWRGKRSPSRLWQRRWNAAPWLRRLSGLTCEPSMLTHGVASWIASLEDTRANPSPSPVRVSPTKTRATSGQMSLAFCESAPPPSGSLRTSAVICREEAARSSQSFKQWATELRRHCLQRRKSALLIAGSDSSSLLPTPSACSYGSNKGGAAGRAGKERPSLETMARTQWATPTVKGNYNRAGASATSGDGLATQVGGQLNPTWVEWLMGLPLGWTACALSGTVSSQHKPPQPLSSSGKR